MKFMLEFIMILLITILNHKIIINNNNKYLNKHNKCY